MEQGTAPFSFFQKQRSEKHRKEGKTWVMFDIQEELKKLPGRPGVYIMHDAKDTIIYVGKAISLKNRVRQYFQSSRNLGIKKEQMVTADPLGLSTSSQIPSWRLWCWSVT